MQNPARTLPHTTTGPQTAQPGGLNSGLTTLAGGCPPPVRCASRCTGRCVCCRSQRQPPGIRASVYSCLVYALPCGSGHRRTISERSLCWFSPSWRRYYRYVEGSSRGFSALPCDGTHMLYHHNRRVPPLKAALTVCTGQGQLAPALLGLRPPLEHRPLWGAGAHLFLRRASPSSLCFPPPITQSTGHFGLPGATTTTSYSCVLRPEPCSTHNRF